jgi:manganese/zinc/iron transport system permease protein
VIGITLLGLAAGCIGCFTMLRKRSLMGDVVSHATLPGIGFGFMLMVLLGQSSAVMGRLGGLLGADGAARFAAGKLLPVLLLGALASGLAGMGCVLLIRRYTRLKEDAALGIVMSVFFGIGVAVLRMCGEMTHGQAAGLENYITGKAASMIASDAQLLAAAAVAVVVCCALMFKEFALLCFDPQYASTQGFGVVLLDMALMVLVVVVTVIGLQAVGLILIIALLVTPPAAARFWTDRLSSLVLLSAGIGMVSGLLGAMISALAPRLPTGPIVVLVAAVMFVASLVFGRARGLLKRAREATRVRRRIGRQNLLRVMYEAAETRAAAGDSAGAALSVDDLLRARAWGASELRRYIASALREHLICVDASRCYRLTDVGGAEARRVVRNHRLWELYLITHADVAPGRVDRGADEIEHALEPVIIERLEQLLASERPQFAVPPSPHPLEGA